MSTFIIESTHPFTIVRFEAESIRNSFGLDQAKELEAILKTKPKGLLLYSGMANVFCSGGNLKDYAKKTKQQCIATNKKIRSVLSLLDAAEIPTVVVIDGDVLGGGIEVLSAFDHVISTPKSLFGFWQRKIALSYGWLGGKRLLRRLSLQTLKTKSLQANLFDASEAKRIGLIDEVVSSHKALEYAMNWLFHQLQLPSESFSTLKNFDVKNEVRKFEAHWGNTSHKKILSRFNKK